MGDAIRDRGRFDPCDRAELRERRVLRWALAGAVVVHALLLTLPLPVGSADAAVEAPPRVVHRLTPLPPPEPEVAPEPLPDRVREPERTIPVPELPDPEPLTRERPTPLPQPDPVAPDLDAGFLGDVLDAPPPPPPAEDGPVHVVAGIEPPEALHAPQPRYPELARRVGREGLVVLQAVIDRDGLVWEVEVLRGAPLGMTEAAEEAVRGWRFRPATREGAPVAVYYQLTVRFRQVR